MLLNNDQLDGLVPINEVLYDPPGGNTGDPGGNFANIDNSGKNVHETTQLIEGINASITDIYNMVDIIQKISAQTNLPILSKIFYELC